MAFYHPRAVDPDGGTVYDRHTRHLVSSTRFVFDYAMAHRHFGGTDFLPMVRHGLSFLRGVHRNPKTGGYAWLLRRQGGLTSVLDATNHCYGLAFVLLAYAHALMAGADEARPWLDETWDVMERRFWEPSSGTSRGARPPTPMA
jgi:mannose/cellobiose epimerase-like protein (N-acyl-D-glucosamine 2-epimerase family)